MKKQNLSKGEIVIYKTSKGPEIEVKMEAESIWLTQAQIALLFGTKRPAITKHLNNIFKNGELRKVSVCSILEHTAADRKTYKTQFYNLDAIISIGYRVNSKRATQFRVWATNILNKYLMHGYAINEKKLFQTKGSLNELQEAISLLEEKSKYELLEDQTQEILSLLAHYSKTLTLLDNYDKDKLVVSQKHKGKFVLTYKESMQVITQLKNNLTNKKEASDFFGKEYECKLEGIIGNIYQSFSQKDLYKSLEEKAAHLLYFVIKDHPFADGNKRIGSFLFVYFLDKNNFLYKEKGEKKINDNALATLALLIAVSNPAEKDKMIKIITNLLTA